MRQDINTAIRKCHLFAGADDASVAALARASRFVRFRRGQVLFMAGDPPDGLYVLQSGLVRIWIADEEGRELTIALMEPGDPFGEIALLDGLPRTANATALEATECLVTPPSALDAALDGNLALVRRLHRAAEQAGADLADGFAVDDHACFGDALQDCEHRKSLRQGLL